MSISFSCSISISKSQSLKCVRPSVRPSVHPSICPSVRPSVRPSVHPSIHPSLWVPQPVLSCMDYLNTTHCLYIELCTTFEIIQSYGASVQPQKHYESSACTTWGSRLPRSCLTRGETPYSTIVKLVFCKADCHGSSCNVVHLQGLSFHARWILGRGAM